MLEAARIRYLKNAASGLCLSDVQLLDTVSNDMNKRGHRETLVASQPGNLNAVKHGVHSPRLLQARAAEIESELTRSFQFSPAQRLAVREAARCMAILEAIDRDLDERGLVDRAGDPRYLLNHRWRASRQLEDWLAKISETIERQAAEGEQLPAPESGDYVRELQRIALGRDPSASARDRLQALKELLKPDVSGKVAASVIVIHRDDEGKGS
jgi:hypothetical protein